MTGDKKRLYGGVTKRDVEIARCLLVTQKRLKDVNKCLNIEQDCYHTFYHTKITLVQPPGRQADVREIFIYLFNLLNDCRVIDNY